MTDQTILWSVFAAVVGLIGGYFMSILANVHTPRLLHFFESRKLIKKHKTRQQALTAFCRIKAFHEGKRDRYPFYTLLAGSAVVCAIISSTLIIITVFQNEFPLAIPFAILILLAAIAGLVTLLLLTGIYETARQIERFNDYQAEIEQRWGPIEDEQPKT